jgi:hypothetical protein
MKVAGNEWTIENPIGKIAQPNRMLLVTKSILAAICFWFLLLALLFVFPDLLPVISGFAIYRY